MEWLDINHESIDWILSDLEAKWSRWFMPITPFKNVTKSPYKKLKCVSFG